MRQYETGFLVSPALTDDEAEAIIQQMAGVVSQKSGKMSRIEKWGKRKMAYPIKKFGEAFYVFFHYESGSDAPLELARRFRQMDTILRHLTLVKETQQNIRKKKKAGGRNRAKETAQEEAATAAAAVAAEASGAEPQKREEA
jgi:small subunit ribosomal protein S6